MATGRHGAFDGSEFKEVNMPRHDLGCSRNHYASITGDVEGNHYKRDRGRVRQKDIRERDAVNGGFKSSSNGCDSGSSSGRSGGVSRWSRFSHTAMDREPGELSSDSGSDGVIDSDPLVRADSDSKFENDTSMREGMPSKAKRNGSDVLLNEKGNQKSLNAEVNRSSPPTPMSALLSSSHQPQYWNRDDDDDDRSPTGHNISTSRWADEENSPSEKDRVSDGGQVRKRRKMEEPVSKFSNPRSASSGEERIGGRSKSTSGSGGSRNHSPVENDDMDVEEGKAQCTESTVDLLLPCTPQRPEVQTQRTVNMLQGCRSVDEFERLNRIDEGTYGVVYRARDKRTGEIVALKKVKMEKEKEGFPLTSLREINILLSFDHRSIVDVKEVVMGNSLDNIFMVMEYMEHDLKGLMETMKQPFSQSEVKCLMIQLLEGVKYLHENWVLHRDLKTSNLLLNNRGELKICDFGLSRQYGSPLKSYTLLVVTLWYRAPELLLGAKKYSTAIDMWSLGCIMAELLSKEPLFNGKTELDQLDKIFKILGTPNENIWPGFSKLPGVKVNFVKYHYNLLRKKFPATSFTGSPVLSDLGFDLLNRLLTYDPDKRITVEAALDHEWFREVPLPKSKDFMPTFPAQHAQDRRQRRRAVRSPDPLEEQRRKEIRQGEIGTAGLFG